MREERLMVDRRGNQWKKYAGYGLTAFFVIAAAILLVFIFVRKDDFSQLTGRITKALAPVILGAVFAYLMNPLMVFFEKKLRNLFYRFARRISKANSAARAISIVLTVICVFLMIGFLMYLLIPQLVVTIRGIINDMPQQVENLQEWYYGLELEGTLLGDYIEIAFVKVTEYVEDFFENRLVDTATNIIGSLATGVKSVVGTIYNILIGLIFAIYMLGSKEKLAAISKKITYAVFKRKKANSIVRITRACHIKFVGSITGKIVDSAIIGVICFVAMTLLDIPYPPLISVIIGVTNVIPFFGPFIGAIPSALLILFASPVKCLWFIIMVFVLQQFDGNILTPKIVGNSIGLSPLWVLFACTVFGSLWGIVGMLIGVPLMACIYMIIKEIVEDRLHSKGLATETSDYQDLDRVDETELFCKVVDTEQESGAETAADTGINNNSGSAEAAAVQDVSQTTVSANTTGVSLNARVHDAEPSRGPSGVKAAQYIPASAKEIYRASGQEVDASETDPEHKSAKASILSKEERQKMMNQLKGLFRK